MHPALPLFQRHILSRSPEVLQNTAPVYNIKGFQWEYCVNYDNKYTMWPGDCSPDQPEKDTEG